MIIRWQLAARWLLYYYHHQYEYEYDIYTHYSTMYYSN